MKLKVLNLDGYCTSRIKGIRYEPFQEIPPILNRDGLYLTKSYHKNEEHFTTPYCWCEKNGKAYLVPASHFEQKLKDLSYKPALKSVIDALLTLIWNNIPLSTNQHEILAEYRRYNERKRMTIDAKLRSLQYKNHIKS